MYLKDKAQIVQKFWFHSYCCFQSSFPLVHHITAKLQKVKSPIIQHQIQIWQQRQIRR